MADAAVDLEFSLLGPLEVRRNGDPIRLGGPRQRSLLALLLLHRNEGMPRERLIDRVWGESPPATVENALQVAVHELRKVLGADRLRSVQGGYELVVEPGALDLDEVESVADRARTGAATATELRHALSRWRGPAATDQYAEGVRGELEHLGELRVFLAEELIEAELARGRHAGVMRDLELLVEEHPYRERPRAQLMVALYRDGRQVEALEAYGDARRTFVDDLGLEPGPELRGLEARVLRQDPSLDAPAVLPELAGRGLPVPPTPLVGRRLEVGAVTGLLRSRDVRLLTLTGVGGSGKTRVALAAAEELAVEYANGAHFIDLAPVGRPELVTGAIARSLGVTESGGDQLLESLVAALEGREMLLVIDNFEHVLAGAPVVAELLAAASKVDVLATSRAPLHLAAEREYPIRPLELPPRDFAGDLVALAGYESVALFTTRVQAVQPDFRVFAENAEAVVGICAALDGLPLALELAAARMKVLSPSTLLERLRRSLDTLTARALDVPERQRTIRAAVNWSLDLLSVEERKLFAKLAAFSGDFSVEAAEGVCDANLEILELLVDTSLLHASGESRFRMLEVIRQRAAELLEEAGEADAMSRRHLEFFLELAETLRPSLRGPGAEAAFAILEQEHENVRAALAYTRDAALSEEQIRLARAVNRFWMMHGYLTEGRDALDEALAAHGTQRSRLRAEALAGVGAIAWRQEDLDAADAFAAESIAIYRELGEEQELVGPLSVAGVVAGSRGDHERAASIHEEAALLARRAGNGFGASMSLNNQAYAAWMQADVDLAEKLWDDCLETARAAATSEVVALAAAGLGDVALARDQPERARERFCEALAINRQLGFAEMQADSCVCLAAAAKARGDLEHAARLLGAAASLRQSIGAAELPNPAVLAYVEDVTDLGRRSLGDEAFAAAFGRGRAAPADVVDEELARGRQVG